MFLNIYKIAGAKNIYGAAHIYYIVRLTGQLYTTEIICGVTGIDHTKDFSDKSTYVLDIFMNIFQFFINMVNMMIQFIDLVL